MNSCNVTGRVGLIAQLRHDRAGHAHLRLRIASNDSFAGAEHTSWFTVHCYEANAVRASQMLHKGQRVYVQGVLIARKYINKEQVEVTELELHAHQIEFLERARAQVSPDTTPPDTPDTSWTMGDFVLPCLDDERGPT